MSQVQLSQAFFASFFVFFAGFDKPPNPSHRWLILQRWLSTFSVNSDYLLQAHIRGSIWLIFCTKSSHIRGTCDWNLQKIIKIEIKKPLVLQVSFYSSDRTLPSFTYCNLSVRYSVRHDISRNLFLSRAVSSLQHLDDCIIHAQIWSVCKLHMVNTHFHLWSSLYRTFITFNGKALLCEYRPAVCHIGFISSTSSPHNILFWLTPNSANKAEAGTMRANCWGRLRKLPHLF